jgi:predicted permease
LQERIQAIAGVTAASLANTSPTSPLQALTYATPDGGQFRAARGHVFPRYFQTVGAHILRARDFDDRDIESGAPLVVVVNESLARNVFPKEDPIGKRIVCSGRDACEIIGVATDIPYSNLRGRAGNAIYYTFLQAPTGRGQMVLHVRFAGDPVRMAADVRHEVARIDPNLPAFEVRTLATEMDAVLVRERLLALLSSAFGAVALLLAGIGLYGVIAYAVGRRTREIGIRMALGATQSEVRLQVLLETMQVAGVGILFGLPVALVTSRFIASFLFGLTTSDPMVLSASTIFLCVIALISGYLPARRASRVDPMGALRYE